MGAFLVQRLRATVLCGGALAACSLTVSVEDLSGGRPTVDAAADGGGAPVDGGSVDAPVDSLADALTQGAPDSASDSGGPTLAYLQKAESASTVSATKLEADAFVPPLPNGASVICYATFNSTSAAIATVTDTAGNAYQHGVGPTRGVGSFGGWSDELWVAVGIVGAANLRVSVAFDAAVSRSSVSCHAYVGVVALEGAQAAAFAGTGTRSTPAIATTSSRALVFSAFGTTGTATTGTDFVTRSTFDGDLMQDRFVTGAGAYVAAASCDTACNASALLFRAR